MGSIGGRVDAHPAAAGLACRAGGRAHVRRDVHACVDGTANDGAARRAAGDGGDGDDEGGQPADDHIHEALLGSHVNETLDRAASALEDPSTRWRCDSVPDRMVTPRWALVTAPLSGCAAGAGLRDARRRVPRRPRPGRGAAATAAPRLPGDRRMVPPHASESADRRRTLGFGVGVPAPVAAH